MKFLMAFEGFCAQEGLFGGETYPVDVVEDVESRRLGRQEPRRKHEKNRAQEELHFEAEKEQKERKRTAKLKKKGERRRRATKRRKRRKIREKIFENFEVIAPSSEGCVASGGVGNHRALPVGGGL